MFQMRFNVSHFMNMTSRPNDKDMELDEDQLSVIRQIQGQKGGVSQSERVSRRHIKVEDLLASDNAQPEFQDWVNRQLRIRAHHRNLLEEAGQADFQTVSAPGFPKAGHAKNPTSTFVKPDMMIGAFTAGLTAQQAIMEMAAADPQGSLKQRSAVLETLLQPSQAQKKTSQVADLAKSSQSDKSGNGDVPASVAALLNCTRSPPKSAVPHHSNSDRGNMQNQKMRKPFFMPYVCKENVERGLRNGDLIKGVLRINQRNFEEAYIDNPEGDDLQDIMLLGVHDRNRALHGDVVVVRLKDRTQWIVRDSLYEAWRSGHMKVHYDEDGGPLTVPPVKSTSKKGDEQSRLSQAIDFLPSGHRQKLDKDKLKDAVPVSKSKRYSQEHMLRLAAQMEVQRLQADGKHTAKQGPAVQSPPETAKGGQLAGQVELDSKAMLQISRLNLTRNKGHQGADAAYQQQNYRRPGSHHGANSIQRRLNYRILADMPDEDWGIPDVCLQKTAEVVFIYEMKNCRTAVGQLKVMADGNRNWGLFSPNDSRIPRMFIPANELPDGFFERPHDFSKFIFIARLVEWQATAQFARGRLYKSLGSAGDIDAETEGLLISNDVDTREFSHSALASLPLIEGEPWKIDEKEFKYRRDFRSECLFTIDPSTARDLDDALHINPIDDCDGEGNPGWEMGVHIADVSHFLQQNTELDKWAEHRATSVYLVHKVIPMLPRILCEELCSLNSGVDRLTFSVVWKMDKEANIKSEWFGRSVIHSCVKLAYDHAQDMIENPEKEFSADQLPALFNGKSAAQVKQCVLNLNEVAKLLKARRVENGCLRLDAEKLRFVLDKESGLPKGVGSDERRDANFLVEEFMLLANQSVARHIESHFPETALLRRHPPPKQKVLRETAEKCELLHFPIDVEDSLSIAESLREYYEDPRVRSTVYPVLIQFVMRSMQLAVYFASGTQKNYHHYALNVPFYTHFTSPIRRYPDVIVHRLLAASLGYTPPPSFSTAELEKICTHCNERKVNAKTVSDQSAEMFFALFIREIGQLTTVGVVIGVLDAAVDVYLLKYNIVKRVYTNRLKLARDSKFVEGANGVLILYWDAAQVAEARGKELKKAGPQGESSKKGSEPKSAPVSVEEPQEMKVEVDSDDEQGDEAHSSAESDEDKEVECTDYAQTLTTFSVVQLVLTPSSEPVKFQGTIVPTPDKFPLRQKDIAKLLA